MKPYYSLTKKIYGLQDATEWDYATLATIATFNYPFITEDEKATEIKVQPFSADDIMSRLRLDSKNKQRHITKIEASIDKLEKAGAIKISRKHNDLYFLSQVISYESKDKRFTSQEEFDNDRSVALLYRLEEKGQVKDKRNWSMALPLIGYLPSFQAVQEEYELSKQDPILQVKFLAMNMGLAMQDTAYYFTAQETIKRAFDLSVFNNVKTYVGIDLSLSNDLTTVAFLAKPDDNYYLHTISFTTQKNYDSCDIEQQELYTRFESEGSLIILESDYIRATDIIAYMKEFKTKTKAKFVKIGYDPSRYENLKALIDLYFYDKEGDKQVPIRQGFSMSDYIQIFKSQIEAGNLLHNQSLMEWSLMNVAVRIGTSGDLMLKKKSQDEKIDPVVASVMAMQVMVADEL